MYVFNCYPSCFFCFSFILTMYGLHSQIRAYMSVKVERTDEILHIFGVEIFLVRGLKKIHKIELHDQYFSINETYDWQSYQMIKFP